MLGDGFGLREATVLGFAALVGLRLLQLKRRKAQRALVPEPMLDADAVMAELAAAELAPPLVLADGYFLPVSGRRAAVLRLPDGGPPDVLWDGGLAEGAREALASRLATPWPGELDGFEADQVWRFGWTQAPAPFRLFNRQGELARVEGDRLLIRPQPGRWRRRPGREIGREAIAHIAAELSDDWIQRGIAVVLHDGTRIPLLERRAWLLAYPSVLYDGLSLLTDTGWVHGIAASAAAALNCEVRTSPYFD